MKATKVFKVGDSQAVRLPPAIGLKGDEVSVKRSAGGVPPQTKKITYEQITAVVSQFRGTFVRRQPRMQKRRWG